MPERPPQLAAVSSAKGTKRMQTTEMRQSTNPLRPARSVKAEPVQRSLEQVRLTPALRGSAALGLLSVGLGLTQLLAPRRVARWIGVDGRDRNTRLVLLAVGVRELTCGIGLLSQSQPALWAWARTAGDLVDLALIGSALPTRRRGRQKALRAAAGVAAVAALDAGAAIALRNEGLDPRGISVTQSVTICRRPDEVYAFYRDFQNLPTFMSHLEFVRVENGISHWRARGPLGSRIEWDAEIVDDQPGQVIAWRSVAGADVPNSGRVRFRPVPGRSETDMDTELIVELHYAPPAGAMGRAVAKLFGEEPAQQIASDLRRLKQVMETGEVLHSDASIHRGMHPARPSQLSREQAQELRK